MPNLYDKTFFLHVAVSGILIIGFALFLRRYKTTGTSEESKARNIVDNLIACIYECKTQQEVDFYESEVDQFYIDWYEILGYDKSMELYNKMTAAVITRTKQLNRAGVKS